MSSSSHISCPSCFVLGLVWVGVWNLLIIHRARALATRRAHGSAVRDGQPRAAPKEQQFYRGRDPLTGEREGLGTRLRTLFEEIRGRSDDGPTSHTQDENGTRNKKKHANRTTCLQTPVRTDPIVIGKNYNYNDQVGEYNWAAIPASPTGAAIAPAAAAAPVRATNPLALLRWRRARYAKTQHTIPRHWIP